jgi:regulation of enolase protein 1 (concanavalin A-like superfamily)
MMKPTGTCLQRVHRALIASTGLVLSVMICALFCPTAPCADERQVFFHTGFDSDTLDPGVTLVRENPSYYSLTERPGFFRLKTQKQSLNSYPQTEPSTENILLAACPDNDFIVDTFLEFHPAEEYHQAGVLIYQDDDHFIKLASAINRGLPQPRFFQFYCQDGPDVAYTNVFVALDQVYLRIERVGDIYTGYYSSDGENYVAVDALTASFETPSAGLIGENGSIGTTTPALADFDYLTISLRVAVLDTIRSLTLAWSSTVGKTYRVQRRETLLTQEWTDISPDIVATDTKTFWTDYGDEQSGRPAPGWTSLTEAYYRIVEQ